MKHQYFHRLLKYSREFVSAQNKLLIPRPIPKRAFCSSCGDQGGASWTSVDGLVKCEANSTPLTPITFLQRSAKVFPDRSSVVYGSLRYTWSETRHRCLKLASALATFLHVSRGHLVATLAPNVPAMYELHFAVPMAGAILCALNTRLDSTMLSTLLAHSQAKVLFVDHQLLNIASEALHLLSKTGGKPPLLVLITDSDENSYTDEPINAKYDYEYESLLANGDDQFEPKLPRDEWDPISVNYTSGTTSRPKGVIYNHRGAYINAISTFLLHEMSSMPTYLWTVPMFHCNGWCLPWGVAAQGGTNICLRKVTPKAIFDSIVNHNVTHMGAAPTVLNMIVNSPVGDRRTLSNKVRILTGGSPPPPQILSKMEELGFEVAHLYGLTETYGPATYSVWKPEWDSLPPGEKSKIKARQGVQHLGLEEVDVRDPITMESVPVDGKTMGEIMFKGNTVMSGYLKDSKATKEAFKGGWFHSGDLAVKHPDNYIEIKDRLKDVIISGGENISTVEVETVLYSHPAILEAAVVARPDNHWGETPCAFVKLKDGYEANEQEIIKFCRDHLPHYMAPKSVIFEEIPKTATGKMQKFILRERAKAMGCLSQGKEEFQKGL
ncbi:isovalerate--CoA ligase CCL2 isoform X2 [Beta vulgaris subsp. vulgaris]|uniref:isovalerate--CoA ligase CCL2 isoform X2 n=1 Tax=Beta vulgaris subsp. vulgaris TaxID=3555 RepID=UPI002036AF3F|nr:isovalerate--CoA ligase CCL2 isoform X2 [Beta vulgaris subsp. vulgaris]